MLARMLKNGFQNLLEKLYHLRYWYRIKESDGYCHIQQLSSYRHEAVYHVSFIFLCFFFSFFFIPPCFGALGFGSPKGPITINVSQILLFVFEETTKKRNKFFCETIMCLRVHEKYLYNSTRRSASKTHIPYCSLNSCNTLECPLRLQSSNSQFKITLLLY